MAIHRWARVVAGVWIAALVLQGTGAGAMELELGDRPGVVDAEFVFEEGPFAECHASTIAETPAGLVCAWFGGTEEKHPDVGIWLARRVGEGWTRPVEVANGVQSATERYPTWNPVLFQPREGPLMLFYKVGPSPSAWWGMVMTSADRGDRGARGETWSSPQRLLEGFVGPVKNKPVQLENGTIVCPSSTEDEGWRLHLEFTSDLGETWTRTEPLNDGRRLGAIQPSILFHRGGEWQLLARDRRGQGNIWTAWSHDGGKTWSELESSGLPNPSAGTDAVTLADGRQLLVYNHTQRGEGPGAFERSRGKLNVAVSEDGRAWQAALVLEDGEEEYSYPAVIQTADGLVHITYTWRRERIRHVVLDPERLELTPIVDGEWPPGKR